MIGPEYSPRQAHTLLRAQSRALKENAAERKSLGLTLRETRIEEGRLEVEEQPVTPVETYVEVPAKPVTTSAPVDAETAYRHARLAVVAALVLALFLVWLMQRKH